MSMVANEAGPELETWKHDHELARDAVVLDRYIEAAAPDRAVGCHGELLTRSANCAGTPSTSIERPVIRPGPG
jgi:hypothetical protein